MTCVWDAGAAPGLQTWSPTLISPLPVWQTTTPSPYVFLSFYARQSSQCLQSLHRHIPAFSPVVSVGLLPYLAFVLLAAIFGLAFYFSTSAKPLCYCVRNTSLMSPQITKSDCTPPGARSCVHRQHSRRIWRRRSLLLRRCLRIEHAGIYGNVCLYGLPLLAGERRRA